MKIYLAGNGLWTWVDSAIVGDGTSKHFAPYILESYFYVNGETERQIPYMGDFLLDSGAFTFIK